MHCQIFTGLEINNVSMFQAPVSSQSFQSTIYYPQQGNQEMFNSTIHQERVSYISWLHGITPSPPHFYFTIFVTALIIQIHILLSLQKTFILGDKELTGADLLKCKHSGKIYQLALDLFAILFPKEEMALGNLTGKPDNGHKDRVSIPKRKLNPERVDGIRGKLSYDNSLL